MSNILIIGGLNINTLSIVEALGQKGIHPDIIITDWRKDNYISKSKYVKRTWAFRKWEDVYKCIVDNFSKEKTKSICIIEGDFNEKNIDSAYNELSKFLILPGIKKQGAVGQWMNKQTMTTAAESVGMHTPISWVVEPGETSPDSVIFPCVTKGLLSASSGKVDSKLFDDKESLDVFLSGVHQCPRIQVQQYIEKEFEFQYIGVSLDEGREVYIPGRTHIGEVKNFDNLSFLRFEPETGNPETLNMAKTFVRNIGYSGLFSIEFIHGKDGKDYFLEMNFRNDGNCNAVTAAGANLPYIWYLYNAGDDYKSEIKRTKVHEIYFCPDILLLDLATKGEISYLEWIKCMRKASAYGIWYKNDKKPFYAWFRANRKRLLKEIRFHH